MLTLSLIKKNRLYVPVILEQLVKSMGSGGGSVGRAVASNSSGLRFKSSHWQNLILNIYCQLY